MSDSLFVVVEYNQASGQPYTVLNGDLFDDRDEAVEAAVEELRRNRADGRRERYAVFELEESFGTEEIEAAARREVSTR